MKNSVYLVAAVVAVVLLSAGVPARADLLTNGNLDDPGTHDSDAVNGWTLTEGPFIPGTPPVVPDFNPNSATFASFANHTPLGADPTQAGLWFRAFEGSATGNKVFAHLTQSVSATPGLEYNLSAWSKFETYYAGGVDNLNAAMTDTTDPSDGLASPTDTFLALEFLGAGDVVLPESVVVELRADGQANNAGWREHLLSAVAPAAALSVQVRGSMIDGVTNPAANPQSAFLDDFTLTAVPEPATFALVGLAVVGLMGIRRRSN